MIRAGELRHRVEVQECIEKTDEYGGTTRAWRTIAERWALVEPLSGREQLMAQQLQATVSHRVTMRTLATVRPTMRLLWGEKVLNIESAIAVGLDTTQLLCREEA
jgi:SPP1 family predicted phage head-tail adaptor